MRHSTELRTWVDEAINSLATLTGSPWADMTYSPMKNEIQQGRRGNPLTLGSAETL